MCQKVKYKKWQTKCAQKQMWKRNKFVTYYYCKKCKAWHLTHVQPQVATQMAFERLDWLRANKPGYV
jgi:hypothetical protein